MAQLPVWTNPSERKILYPDNEYLVAIYSVGYDKSQPVEQKIQQCLDYAKTDVAESVQVSIHSMTTTDVTETNTKVQDFFNHKAAVFSDLTIAGLKSESYKDEKAKIIYALAYAKKVDIVNHYKNEITQKKSEASGIISAARALTDAGKKSQAIMKYYEAMSLIRIMEQDQAILLALDPSQYDGEISATGKSVNEAISALANNPERTLEDACFFIAEGLRNQVKVVSSPVTVSMFSYQDTQMGSDFSFRLGSQLQQELVRQGFNIVTTRSVNPNSTPETKVIYGTYWKENENLNIMAIIRDPQSSRIIASAEATLPVSWLMTNNISYLPDNYNEALEQIKTFRKDEIINGGLMVELMTNHGKDNALYQEDDTLIMYVKVNRECYVRVIYYQADGSKVLLQDDYFISADMANKFIQLPDKNVATAPFGVETLQLNAQTSRFQPLPVKMSGGYKFIDEDLATIVTRTRGFKAVSEENLGAEKRITITTVKKVN